MRCRGTLFCGCANISPGTSAARCTLRCWSRAVEGATPTSGTSYSVKRQEGTAAAAGTCSTRRAGTQACSAGTRKQAAERGSS
jgi:hypothetical protein